MHLEKLPFEAELFRVALLQESWSLLLVGPDDYTASPIFCVHWLYESLRHKLRALLYTSGMMYGLLSYFWVI